MNYKIILYTVDLIVAIIALNSVNFNTILKKNKTSQGRLLILVLAIIISYILTNFIIDFVS